MDRLYVHAQPTPTTRDNCVLGAPHTRRAKLQERMQALSRAAEAGLQEQINECINKGMAGVTAKVRQSACQFALCDSFMRHAQQLRISAQGGVVVTCAGQGAPRGCQRRAAAVFGPPAAGA